MQNTQLASKLFTVAYEASPDLVLLPLQHPMTMLQLRGPFLALMHTRLIFVSGPSHAWSHLVPVQTLPPQSDLPWAAYINPVPTDSLVHHSFVCVTYFWNHPLSLFIYALLSMCQSYPLFSSNKNSTWHIISTNFFWMNKWMPLVQNYFSPFLSPPSLHLNALSFREHGSYMEGDREASTNICWMNEEKMNYTNKECQPLNA